MHIRDTQVMALVIGYLQHPKSRSNPNQMDMWNLGSIIRDLKHEKQTLARIQPQPLKVLSEGMPNHEWYKNKPLNHTMHVWKHLRVSSWKIGHLYELKLQWGVIPRENLASLSLVTRASGV